MKPENLIKNLNRFARIFDKCAETPGYEAPEFEYGELAFLLREAAAYIEDTE